MPQGHCSNSKFVFPEGTSGCLRSTRRPCTSVTQTSASREKIIFLTPFTDTLLPFFLWVWTWGQENKIYACMMVFFFSNMIENQLMSTGAFEISLNDVPVWSKLESGHLPSMQQLVQILENELKMNVHMDTLPHARS
ncbi:hypothetical protein AALO_G00009540 [Alosa alosa]|uniref:Selenoprotein T n=1 Tax=Alosa alosa TaxID=278164 RepID=A0AAV6HF39_9TELE|nr:hypothetical protein AALO_G00009540 [Alosa alosa]